ncbi:MAG TPA: DUF1761 domain-containing protein [Actinoplanes sp.]|nr:DUF1761 domain-containing protein [Actinoplanes sp.]
MVVRILVAVVAAFVISSVWYVAFGTMLARLSPAYAGGGRTPLWVPVFEIIRSAVLAVVIAAGIDRLGVDGAGPLLLAALVTWIGFPVVLLSGSVLHERVPWRLAAIHAGDWLLKLIAITLIVGWF